MDKRGLGQMFKVYLALFGADLLNKYTTPSFVPGYCCCPIFPSQLLPVHDCAAQTHTNTHTHTEVQRYLFPYCCSLFYFLKLSFVHVYSHGFVITLSTCPVHLIVPSTLSSLPCSCNVRSPICCFLGYQQQPPHQLHITRARKKAQIRTRRATRALKFRVTRAHPLISNKTGNHSSTLTSLYLWRAWKLFSKRERKIKVS